MLAPSDLLNPTSPLSRIRDAGTRRALLDLYIENFDEAAAQLARKLHAGQLSAAAWERAMRSELKTLHIGALVISRGGEWQTITQAEWGRLGRYVRDQYAYLHRYAGQVQQSAENALTGGDFFSERYLEWRSQLYGGNARASFYRGLAMGLLSQVPGDGKTECKTSCKCELRFEEGDQPGLLLVFWELRPAEHCASCVKLSQEWNPLELWPPVGMEAREWVTWLPVVTIAR